MDTDMAQSFTHHANSDYTVVDRNPLQLAAGDRVQLGPLDQAWPGWVWAIDRLGRGSFVPEDHLRYLDSNSAEVVRAFNARDLSVRRLEAVIVLREVKGWMWCRNSIGEEGWLPEFVLQ